MTLSHLRVRLIVAPYAQKIGDELNEDEFNHLLNRIANEMGVTKLYARDLAESAIANYQHNNKGRAG